MMICTNCVLPKTFPGIKYNDDGVCQYCLASKSKTAQELQKSKYKKKFLEIIDKVRSIGPYDVIIAYSGGKDSSYILKKLKEDFNLKVLSITFDHGFVSYQALKNIRAVTENLGVDHVMVTPNQAFICKAFSKSITENIYPLKALERASSICNTCMNLTKSLLMKTTIEMGIPLVAYGWSPGQAPIQSSVMRLNPSMIRMNQSVVINIFQKIVGNDFQPYVLQNRHYKLLDFELEKFNGKFCYNVHPLAFVDYNEDKIINEIKTVGWEPPQDTDANSTNCLLNAFANRVHQEQYDFHPYAFEIGDLVRKGLLSREKGLDKLNEPPDEKIIDYAKDKLKIS